MKKRIYIIIIIVISLLVLMFGLHIIDTNIPNPKATNIIQSFKANKDLEKAIVEAMFFENKKSYLEGEVQTEGHKILKIKNHKNLTEVYMIASYGEYGFENGIFTKVSGSGAIPIKITFIKNDKNKYVFKDYVESDDGEEYLNSLKKIFPKSIFLKVLNADKYYDGLSKQEEKYAKEYLKTIKREAKVQEYVEKKLDTLADDASNELLEKYNNYPYWIGTFEKIEKGTRFVYKTSFKPGDKKGDGIVTYTKKEYKGRIIEKTIITVKNGKILSEEKK